jgi:twitching motility protein PilT
LFANRQSFIRQREIPTHSPSFEQGIVDALRENPDVLVISEMRTPEVMRLTLNAAETGHLVLATMHSSNCAEALSRLCMSFPEGIQGSVRAQLADCLVAVCCQRLEFLSAPRLHVPRCEILLPSSGARGTIRSGNFSQIATVLQSGGEEGMWTFDRYQRWMEQVTDWVRPPSSAALRVQGEAALRAGAALHAAAGLHAGARLRSGARPLSPRAVTATPTQTRAAEVRPPPQPGAGSASSAEEIIDVPAEEMDLAALAELAKNAAERKT